LAGRQDEVQAAPLNVQLVGAVVSPFAEKFTDTDAPGSITSPLFAGVRVSVSPLSCHCAFQTQSTSSPGSVSTSCHPLTGAVPRFSIVRWPKNPLR